MNKNLELLSNFEEMTMTETQNINGGFLPALVIGIAYAPIVVGVIWAAADNHIKSQAVAGAAAGKAAAERDLWLNGKK